MTWTPAKLEERTQSELEPSFTVPTPRPAPWLALAALAEGRTTEPADAPLFTTINRHGSPIQR